MRYSTGIEVSYAEDSQGPGVIIQGNILGRVTIPSDSWIATLERIDARYWRLKKGETLMPVAKPCPSYFEDVLTKEMDTIVVEAIHPSFSMGFYSEAQRLFPEISKQVVFQFNKFLLFLNQTFGFNMQTAKSDKMLPYTDDFGPNLLSLIDGLPTVLPEIPILYLAPENWRKVTWMVTNHMIGPMLIPGIADEEKIKINNLELSIKEYTPFLEGLFYFQAARFIIIFEAWQGNLDAPYLAEFMKIITSGVRPLQKCIIS
jgi:hypothetical protein